MLIFATLLLALAAVVCASVIPARRAAEGVEPMVALRNGQR